MGRTESLCGTAECLCSLLNICVQLQPARVHAMDCSLTILLCACLSVCPVMDCCPKPGFRYIAKLGGIATTNDYPYVVSVCVRALLVLTVCNGRLVSVQQQQQQQCRPPPVQYRFIPSICQELNLTVMFPVMLSPLCGPCACRVRMITAGKLLCTFLLAARSGCASV